MFLSQVAPLDPRRPSADAGEGRSAAPASPSPPALPGSFAELFASHAPYVLGLLRRLGVREAEVEDVAQEVFLAVHRQLAEFEGRSTLRTWICGIAVRAAHNHRRRAYRRREVPASLSDSPHEPQVAPTQLARVQAAEDAQRLLEALDALSPAQREVFVLFEVEQLPMAEVAQLVGCPRFTAYTRLRSARARVRASFERRERGGGRS